MQIKGLDWCEGDKVIAKDRKTGKYHKGTIIGITLYPMREAPERYCFKYSVMLSDTESISVSSVNLRSADKG